MHGLAGIRIADDLSPFARILESPIPTRELLDRWTVRCDALTAPYDGLGKDFAQATLPFLLDRSYAFIAACVMAAS